MAGGNGLPVGNSKWERLEGGAETVRAMFHFVWMVDIVALRYPWDRRGVIYLSSWDH